MLPVIERLLILQDRDRNIMRVEAELANIGPERNSLDTKAKDAQTGLEAAKVRLRQIESDRKKLELDAEAKKQQMDKYATQQLQTKKNEEYKALSNEIENCKKIIFDLENQQIELMEKADAASAEVAAAAKVTAELLKIVEEQKKGLADREVRLKRELSELKADYDKLSESVHEDVRNKYIRLRKQKGGTTVVGIQHSVCGGCHMKLPMQIVYSCQNGEEIVNCPNCGRILYFTRDMDLAIVD
ncbi:MAG: zinc ribbon domain-containing protein [Verrucomicrobiales bacterium]